MKEILERIWNASAAETFIAFLIVVVILIAANLAAFYFFRRRTSR